jgi:hypothetical protein
MAKRKKKAEKVEKAEIKPMTGPFYTRAVAKLGLSVYASRHAVGLGLRQTQRIASGEAPVPRAVAKLINLMLAGKVSVEEAINAG